MTDDDHYSTVINLHVKDKMTDDGHYSTVINLHYLVHKSLMMVITVQSLIYVWKTK